VKQIDLRYRTIYMTYIFLTDIAQELSDHIRDAFCAEAFLHVQRVHMYIPMSSSEDP